MRFIIYGAGGIGGVMGARLFQNGHSVVLIARGAHLQAVQQKGLVFETPNESMTLAIPAVAHPQEIVYKPGDVVLLTMKTQHCSSALDDLRKAAGDDIPVICCQNGVAAERMALRRFKTVYAMTVFLPASHLSPGVVQSNCKNVSGILDAGLYPQGQDARIGDITAILNHSQFSSRPNDRVMRWKYTKLLLNLHNALQAACPQEDGYEDIRTLLREEGKACYGAAGIDYASESEDQQRRGILLQFGKIHGEKRVGSSTVQSLLKESGDIEADYLNGEIVLLGRLHGIATPANLVLQQIANQMAHNRQKPASISIQEMKALIEQTSSIT